DLNVRPCPRRRSEGCHGLPGSPVPQPHVAPSTPGGHCLPVRGVNGGAQLLRPSGSKLPRATSGPSNLPQPDVIEAPALMPLETAYGQDLAIRGERHRMDPAAANPAEGRDLPRTPGTRVVPESRGGE